MKRISGKWKGALFLVALSVLLLFAGERQVSAATKKCKVTFANYKGEVSTSTYKSWGRTVKPGQWIYLPKYSWSGYRCYWEIRTGKTTKKYTPGAKYKVTKDVKFCLQRYKLYDVRFYTSDGKKEYPSLKKSVLKEEYITLPSVPHSSKTVGLGWSNSVKGNNYKKAGTKIKVNGNLKFYSRVENVTSVNLIKYNGRFWKSVSTNTGKTPTFPAVNLRSSNMCLGWSTKMGDKVPMYYAGDKIPTKTGNYYMVKFGPEDDRAPASVRIPQKHDMVYFVGDSRTVQMQWGLQSRKPSNVDIIAKSGQGLEWFQERSDTGGYKMLYRKVRKLYETSGGKAKQAVIINLGINDITMNSSYQTVNEYINYMKRVSDQLRKEFKCDMYYMSVNPVNSAIIQSYGAVYGGAYRTEKQVEEFNKNLYYGLCSGRNGYFKYIDAYTALQKYGWSSRMGNGGLYDGIHYSYPTYLRIYDYCIKNLNG